MGRCERLEDRRQGLRHRRLVHGDEFAVSFKCSEASFAILNELPGLRPAPYLASRGLSWIQRVDAPLLSDHDLKEYIQQSYAIILAALPKKTQEALRARVSR